MQTTPRHLTTNPPTWECRYCDHVLTCQPGTNIAKNARLRHHREHHPKKPRAHFLLDRKQYHRTAQLHVAVRNRSSIKYLSAKATSDHELQMLRTRVWPWSGPVATAKLRPQTRTFWYCLRRGQSAGNAGYIVGKHISKTKCQPCGKRGNLKLSLSAWDQKTKWLLRARSTKRLAKFISAESIAVATRLAERAADLYLAAPVSRSVKFKERKGQVTKLAPGAERHLAAARTRALHQ